MFVNFEKTRKSLKQLNSLRLFTPKDFRFSNKGGNGKLIRSNQQKLHPRNLTNNQTCISGSKYCYFGYLLSILFYSRTAIALGSSAIVKDRAYFFGWLVAKSERFEHQNPSIFFVVGGCPVPLRLGSLLRLAELELLVDLPETAPTPTVAMPGTPKKTACQCCKDCEKKPGGYVILFILFFSVYHQETFFFK